jgi:hypothetical protein
MDCQLNQRLDKYYNNTTWILDFITEKIDEQFAWIVYHGVKTVIDVKDGYFLYYNLKSNKHFIDGLSNKHVESYNLTQNKHTDKICSIVYGHTYQCGILSAYELKNIKTLEKKSLNPVVDQIVNGIYEHPISLPILAILYPSSFTTCRLDNVINLINSTAKYSADKKMINNDKHDTTLKIIQEQSAVIST